MYHAAPSVEAVVDIVQSDFLEALGISERQALSEFHLAPLNVRRDIAMLGLLHKCALGTAPRPLLDTFPRSSSSLFHYGFVRPAHLHNRQLHDPVGPSSPKLLLRSIFGLINIYNILPEEVVDSEDVKIFQRRLQRLVRQAAAQSRQGWANLLRRDRS